MLWCNLELPSLRPLETTNNKTRFGVFSLHKKCFTLKASAHHGNRRMEWIRIPCCHDTHVTVLLLSNVMPHTTIQLISSLQHIEFTFPSNNIVKSELHRSVEKVNFEHQGVFYNHSLMLRNEILYAFSYTMLCNCQWVIRRKIGNNFDISISHFLSYIFSCRWA